MHHLVTIHRKTHVGAKGNELSLVVVTATTSLVRKFTYAVAIVVITVLHLESISSKTTILGLFYTIRIQAVLGVFDIIPRTIFSIDKSSGYMRMSHFESFKFP